MRIQLAPVSYCKPAGSPEAWDYNPDQIMQIVRSFDDKLVTEVHIVGGVHPAHDLHYYGRILAMIKAHRPELHIKAFTAIESDYTLQQGWASVKDWLP
ncbi:MAG: hypothetical protein R2727_05570 [Bacteroidales bacterium]